MLRPEGDVTEHISNAPVVGSSANAAIQVELTGATVTQVTISPVWRALAQHYDLREALTEAAQRGARCAGGGSAAGHHSRPCPP